MPDIEISEECRALIAVEFEIDETARRLPNGNWQIPIDEETLAAARKGETVRRVDLGMYHPRHNHHPTQARLAIDNVGCALMNGSWHGDPKASSSTYSSAGRSVLTSSAQHVGWD
jgi:hypothetical protein